jgi:phage terminase large subunit-like protein
VTAIDPAQLSAAQRFLLLPASVREARLAELTDRECDALLHDWAWWARPNQQLPPGDWTTWLILAGRGYGKTRTGAETTRHWARSHRYVNLIGPTADDARDVMIEGESGILAVCPRDERPIYRPSKRLLVWPNGARSLIFTADEPERLRGKQHGKLWCDELASWRYLEAWDQAMLGLRLGSRPQAVATTTPKPIKLIKDLLAKASTHVTRGTTYENVANLARAFLSDIITKYEGTRVGRQELKAEVLDDNPNALWQRKQIDDARVSAAPALTRIVVAIDPAVTSNEDSDETGIIAVGRDARSPAHFYVLEDRSLIASPAGWARAAIVSYYALTADRVIGETNNGGEMVESTLRNVDENVSYKAVRASRGKVTRAEPVAALYEQGRVHHVGSLPFLEDQMCDFDPTVSSDSPDRMDALVWGVSELMEHSGAESYLTFLDRQLAAQKAAQAKATDEA